MALFGRPGKVRLSQGCQQPVMICAAWPCIRFKDNRRTLERDSSLQSPLPINCKKFLVQVSQLISPVMLDLVQQKSDIAPEREAAAAAADSAANELAEKTDTMSLVEKQDADATDINLSATDAYIKHPLQNSWTMWFLHPDKSRDWEDRVIPIISFDTVEDFWSIYNHIKTPAEFSLGHDYYLFKQGIK